MYDDSIALGDSPLINIINDRMAGRQKASKSFSVEKLLNAFILFPFGFAAPCIKWFPGFFFFWILIPKRETVFFREN